MASRCLTFLLVLLILWRVEPICQAANPVKMRPYTGIGVVVLPATAAQALEQPLYMYQEPGITRMGAFDSAKLSSNEWIFGAQKLHVPLIVMGRKGNWLRICYDDAGREAWIEARRRDTFRPWDDFFRSRMIRMLPGLRKQYYQLYQQPDHDPGASLTPKQSLKVLKLENDWAMVVSDQTAIGWLRWRDEDGRLNVGLD